jgi:porphobilinogen synthase
MLCYRKMILNNLKTTKEIRKLFSETDFINPSKLIMPIFIKDGNNEQIPIKNLDDNFIYTIDKALEKCKKLKKLGINTIALFPSIEKNLKDKNGSYGIKADNITCRAISEIKNAIPEMVIMSDVALDPYTDHGHDGILSENLLSIDRNHTIDTLTAQALNQLNAGADIVAPSDMTDGRILAIKKAMIEDRFEDRILISYSAKFASCMYSPFRDAVQSSLSYGPSDKKSYQLDFSNPKMSMMHIERDISEGADAVIIKPASVYLDIIKEASQRFDRGIFAYHVSGEYAMLCASAKAGILDFDKSIVEVITSIKRSGASCIITYAAEKIAMMSGFHYFN